jgi:cell division protein FtsN
MSNQMKKLLWILAGLLVLFFGNYLTNQSHQKETARIQANQESAQSGSDSYVKENGNAKKAIKSYNPDLLKKSLGGD